jgi:hypothetical protein
MYYSGKGIVQDYQEAMTWYKKAAENGDADAQYILGVIYELGEGIPQNYIEACKWYILAAAQSQPDANAIKFRDNLEQKMTPQQIAEAQRLAKEFRPKADNSATKDSTKSKQGDKATLSGTNNNRDNRP